MMAGLPESQSEEKGAKVVADTLEFFMYVGQLKVAKRTGWVHHNVKNVESVSDHMYRMGMMTMLLDNKQLNTSHCMKLALVHDLAECIVGDITPYCGISPEEKHQKEKDAMLHLIGLIHNETMSNEIMSLWEEYNKRETPEAKAVKDFDRFEMILQAYEYEKAENRVGDLERFFTGVEGKFEHPEVKTWVKELYDRRSQSKEETKK